MENKFVINPNLPTTKVSEVIVDGRISKEAEEKINELGIYCIKTVKCNNTYEEISYHPDIQMIHIGDNNIVISNNMFEQYEKDFKSIDFNCIKGESSISFKYPNDIQYNACIMNKYFIHNLKYTDKILIKKMNEKDMKLVDIKQGYSKCSISIVNSNSIITSDRNIEKMLSKYLDVLFIEEKNIKLGNMQGSIGGATGLIDKNKWCINGDINYLKECNKILDFIQERNIDIICLTNKEVIDIGTMIPVMY